MIAQRENSLGLNLILAIDIKTIADFYITGQMHRKYYTDNEFSRLYKIVIWGRTFDLSCSGIS